MITVRGLTKSYRHDLFKPNKEVLKGVSFEVRKGDLFGFIGPNGAGKSTTLKIILGLIKKGAGEVSVLGVEPGSVKAKASLGYLPEHPYFYEYLSGRELLNFYGSLYGMSKNDVSRRIAELALQLDIKAHWIDKPLKTYSKGMVQKIGFAQAIIHNPNVLILDEPMSGLDPVARKQVRELMQKLNGEGTTILYSSHVLSDVESLSNRVALLVDGTIRLEGDLKSLIQKQGNDELESILMREVSRVKN